MSISDLERAFYETVLADTDNATITDLRKAYYLAGIDGSLPAPAPLANVVGSQLAVGQSTLPRETAIASGNLVAGTLRLTHFTSIKSETVTSVRMTTGAAGVTATPTLIRVGLYHKEANGDLTRVAATASDLTLLAAGSTAYTKAFAAGYALVEGERYAVGVLVVSGVAVGSLMGISYASGAEAAIAPRTTSQIAGQTDLPTSIPVASQAVNPTAHYFALLPA